MTGTPPDHRAWLGKADEDLEMARRALDPMGPLPTMACYHAQQAAEKHLKAYLVARQAYYQKLAEVIWCPHRMLRGGRVVISGVGWVVRHEDIFGSLFSPEFIS